MKMLQDSEGNWSSFRIMWSFFIMSIILTWAVTSVMTKVMQKFPIDGITVLGLFTSSGIKTFTERQK